MPGLREPLIDSVPAAIGRSFSAALQGTSMYLSGTAASMLLLRMTRQWPLPESQESEEWLDCLLL